MIKNYLLFSTLVLASHSYAGDISSGGVPDIELVRCNNVLRVWTPVHSETPFIAISITDPELVSEPIHTELTFEFGEGQAYFFAHDSRFQNIDLYLDVKRGASGFYEGYFSFGL
ncbi:MAG: hypothetical protein NTV34_00950, partial [Proteobacteria bacterium]|nr:hypothetical protein [Pseudomonadota bacterium]